MSKRPSVTLCMIVKNEEHIIRECLDSMVGVIDRYDISDTGSTDKTKEVIREWGEKNNIPGEVYDIPWKGFGKSRTEAFKNAEGKADYAWVIDADDKLEGDFKYPKEFGEHDSYALNIHRGDFNWWRQQIFKLSAGWEYVGVLHEYANAKGLRDAGGTPTAGRIEPHPHYHIEARTMGDRTVQFGDDQSAKYTKDAETLIDCLTNPENENYEPDNLRYEFYVAQSYFDAQNIEKALEWYEKRAVKGGWDEEVWYCVYRIAICKCLLKTSWEEAQDHFLQAWNIRPHRAEPLYQLARIHRQNGNPRLGYLFAKTAMNIPFPQGDILFLANDVYEWQIADELASSAYYVGDMVAGLEASNKLLEDKKFPDSEKDRIVNNFSQYAKWLEEQNAAQQKVQQELLQKQVEEKMKRTKAPAPRRKKKAKK